MARMTPEEKRALNQDEQELSDLARQPRLSLLSDGELSDLIRRLRDRRDRARDIGDRQGREARGKAAPAGTSAATSNAGTRSKHDYLNAALRRTAAERKKRQGAGKTQAEVARKAANNKAEAEAADMRQDMKEDGGPLHPHDPDADRGKQALEDTGRMTNQSGALEHVGDRPARMRSTHRR